MHRQLVEYDKLRAGKVTKFKAATLTDLPQILIRARIVRALSTAELAERLGWKASLLERLEELEYQTATWEKILRVAEELGVEVESKARLTEKKPLASIEEMLEWVGEGAEEEEKEEETV